MIPTDQPGQPSEEQGENPEPQEPAAAVLPELDEPLTVEVSIDDFKDAVRARAKLIERQRDDIKFRLGKQWSPVKEQQLKDMGVTPVTDNRIQPNIQLLTGLERQNRSDFKAFPEGEEDSTEAEIATALFKDQIKKSDFDYKSSEGFEDGITCGISWFELYLDNTYDYVNAKCCWGKTEFDRVFPERGAKEYDYFDANYVYKLTTDVPYSKLVSMFPEKKVDIDNITKGNIDIDSIFSSDIHNQKKDYAKGGASSGSTGQSSRQVKKKTYDLIERYYKKWVLTGYIADTMTGHMQKTDSPDAADQAVANFKEDVAQEQLDYQKAQVFAASDPTGRSAHMLAGLQPRDPNQFKVIKRYVPEIWYFAHVGMETIALADEQAWFYPKWKRWPLLPYMALNSTFQMENDDDSHLLCQGIVYGVKDVQQKHNSVETLKLMHLNSSANSGWLSEEDAWVDADMVKNFGSAPGVDLQYKTGKPMPKRIEPTQLSQAFSQISVESAEAIKNILGINADLLATQQGGTDSGRAIALRQKQGLLMVQKLFDNLSRTKKLCGSFLLSQLGECYDTDTAKKILGEAYLAQTFPPPMVPVMDQAGQQMIDPGSGQPAMQPAIDPNTQQPMIYDDQAATQVIQKVLSGDLEQYDVAVGESVSSETLKMANSMELQDLAKNFPGIFPPELLVEESSLQSSTKQRALSAIKQAQMAAMQTAQAGRVPAAKP